MTEWSKSVSERLKSSCYIRNNHIDQTLNFVEELVTNNAVVLFHGSSNFLWYYNINSNNINNIIYISHLSAYCISVYGILLPSLLYYTYVYLEITFTILKYYRQNSHISPPLLFLTSLFVSSLARHHHDIKHYKCFHLLFRCWNCLSTPYAHFFLPAKYGVLEFNDNILVSY